MSVKIIVLVFIFYPYFAKSQRISPNTGFTVVSTTGSPSDNLFFEDQEGLKNLLEKEQRRNEELTQKLNTIEQRLSLLERQKTGLTPKPTGSLEQNGDLGQKLDEMVRQVSSINENIEYYVYQKLPRDCKEVLKRGHSRSGTYLVQPGSEPFLVLCDMTTRGGGWTVFQNRFDGSQNFYLNWSDYKHGFGNLSGEFWLGLEHLYELTGSKHSELLIQMTDANSTEAYAYYNNFGIIDGESYYKLKYLDGYEGTAGDCLKQHLGQKFATKDKNDKGNCAITFEGGWWFNTGYSYCINSNLNGKYLDGKIVPGTPGTGLHWYQFSGDEHSLLKSKMMIRHHH